MLSLLLDTCSKTAISAIFDNDKLITEIFVDTGFTHSQTAMPMIDFIFNISKTDISQIGTLVVTVGPGSFTGLRIGISTIKGLAFANGNKCKAISTLEALAYNLIDFDGIICPVMDAKCNQFYNSIFFVQKGKINRLKPDRAISLDNLKDDLKKYKNEKIYLLGDGAEICYNYLIERNKGFYLVSSYLRYQRALGLFLAAQKAPFISSLNLVPQYLRLSQAQKQLLKKE